MARKATPGTQFGVSPKKIQDYTKEILEGHDKLDKFAGEHMNRCRRVRDQINDVYATAKNAGIDKQALKLAVKEKLTRRKLDLERKALDPEQIDMFDYIAQCTGIIDDDDESEKPAAARQVPKSIKDAADRAESRGNVTALVPASA